MRIHTNHHTADSIHAALRNCQDAGLIHPAVQIDICTPHGSRTRARAFEVQLGAPDHAPHFLAEVAQRELRDGYAGALPDGGRKAIRAASIRRRRNGGNYGASQDFLSHAATWHEWGYFLAALFAADGWLSTTYYKDAADFAIQTTGESRYGVGFTYWAERGRVADFLTAVGDLPDPIAQTAAAAA